MSNYRMELKGFALDRAIKLFEAEGLATGESIFDCADKITEYIYIPDKDIESHIKSLMPLIEQAGDIDKLDNLILGLQQIRAEMEAGIIGGNPAVRGDLDGPPQVYSAPIVGDCPIQHAPENPIQPDEAA